MIYYVPSVRQRCHSHETSFHAEPSLTRWHLQFAHLNVPALNQMACQQVTTGMNCELNIDFVEPCWSCQSAKMIRMSYKKSSTRRSTQPFQNFMSDMCYVGFATYDGYKHFQLVQDEASRYLWGLLMKQKADSTEIVLVHVKWLLAQGHKIEVFNSDQGRKLLSRKMCLFLRNHGIEYTWTNSYSPEENGLVEKMNGIVMSQVRYVWTTADMPFLLWREALNFAVEVRSISASSTLNGNTPYFRCFGEGPNITLLRTWGCFVYVFTPSLLRTLKLDNPGKSGLFVGYAKHSESCRVLSMETGRVNKVRSDHFYEDWTTLRSYVERVLSIYP